MFYILCYVSGPHKLQSLAPMITSCIHYTHCNCRHDRCADGRDSDWHEMRLCVTALHVWTCKQFVALWHVVCICAMCVLGRAEFHGVHCGAVALTD